MTQFLIEEAAATCLELHEAALQAKAADEAAHQGESDVRARHRQLMQQVTADGEGG